MRPFPIFAEKKVKRLSRVIPFMEHIIFELITPPHTWSNEKVNEWISHAISMLENHNISHVSVPEITDESRDKERVAPYVAKIDNLDFIELIKKQKRSFVFIPCKICVIMPKNAFHDWVKVCYEKGIRHVIIVGGESSKINYPGYSVVEAISYIKLNYPDMLVGGIAIFTRAKEAKRIVSKIEAGVDFLVSQIIFETANMQQVILSVEHLCKEMNFVFPKIFLSLAPAACIRDLSFMKWLGVEFPSAIYSYLIEEGDDLVAERSFEILDRIVEEGFRFMAAENIQLGFNIEHVMYSNFDLSEKLLLHVQQRKALCKS